MILILPLTPILAAIALFSMIAADGIKGHITAITTVIMLIAVIVEISIFCVNLRSVKQKSITVGKLFANAFVGLVAIIASYFCAVSFNSVSDGLSGTFDFLIMAILLVPLWLYMLTSWWAFCSDDGESKIGPMCAVIGIAIYITWLYFS